MSTVSPLATEPPPSTLARPMTPEVGSEPATAAGESAVPTIHATPSAMVASAMACRMKPGLRMEVAITPPPSARGWPRRATARRQESRGLRHELMGERVGAVGVRVGLVAPGATATPRRAR